jgi:hypothetical protein
MLKKILKESPCIGEDQLREWSKHWPKNVSLYWLLTHPKRGKEVVESHNHVWLAEVLLSADAVSRAQDAYYNGINKGKHSYGDDHLIKEYAKEAKKLVRSPRTTKAKVKKRVQRKKAR